MDLSSQDPCDLCGGNERERLLEKNEALYTRCSGCGFIATSLPEGDSDRENAEYFERTLAKYVAKAFSERKQCEYSKRLEMFRNHRKTGRILEIGANVGGFVHRAREEGWESSGVEPVEACAHWGRDNRDLDLRACTLEEAGFPDDHFDGIYSNNVFEHLARPSRVFEEVARVLRPGGLVYIDTVNYDSYTRRFIGKEWKLIDPRHHFCLYTPQTLRRFCEKVGLKVLAVKTHGVRFRPNHLPNLRGWRRWAEEVKKLPWSAATRLTDKGDSIAVFATKP